MNDRKVSTLTFLILSAGIFVLGFLVTAYKFPGSRISCFYPVEGRFWWRLCVGLIFLLFLYWLFSGLTPWDIENYYPEG
jgi:hypothetical protein